QKEKAIWDQLQQVAPKAVDDFKAGTVALDNGNFEEAIKRYRSVTEQAPEFDHGIRRLGLSWAAAGKTDEALVLLESALNLNRSPENLSGLAQTLAYRGENVPVSPLDKQRA